MATPSNNYDAFISYRREGGSELAQLIRHDLQSRKINAFLDVEDLGSHLFDEKLFQVIEHAPNFIVLLTTSCLDRCDDPDDWFRQEIEHALDADRNIIPVIRHGFQFPQAMPKSIASIRRYSGVEYVHTYFRPAMDKLVQFIKEGMCERFIERALDEVDREVAALQERPWTLSSVLQLIRVAIGHGAPIYNAGDIPGCAEIYLRTARGILECFSSNDGGNSMTLKLVLNELHKFRGLTLSGQDPKTLAWALREAFDRIQLLAVVEAGIAEVDKELSRPEASGVARPLSQQVDRVIRAAIAHGNILYRESFLKGCAYLHQHAAAGILNLLPDPKSNHVEQTEPVVNAAREVLTPLVSKPVSDSTADSLAWTLFLSFTKLLELCETSS